MPWTLFQFVSRALASMNQFGAAARLVSGVTVRRVLRPSLGHVFTFPPMSRRCLAFGRLLSSSPTSLQGDTLLG